MDEKEQTKKGCGGSCGCKKGGGNADKAAAEGRKEFNKCCGNKDQNGCCKGPGPHSCGGDKPKPPAPE